METQELIVDLGDRSYPIFIGEDICKIKSDFLAEKLAGKKCLIVTDTNLADLHLAGLQDLLAGIGAEVSTYSFEAGEKQKHIGTMAEIYAAAVKAKLDRKSYIIAFGGGVAGDMAGFAAATYMRGIPFIQVPTSLLAMVDSSVGGKTGIDLPEGKNLVGAFWQPDAVLIDTSYLKTLPNRELLCGLAEVVKYSIIMDAEFFDLLMGNSEPILNLDLKFYAQIIKHCCQCKADVVAKDELEGGLRAILNYGHTFGHAIEAIAGFGVVEHGEGVAIGMMMAGKLATMLGMFSESELVKQLQLIEKLQLPTTVADISSEAILKAMDNDKKKDANTKKFILPKKIGEVDIVSNIDDDMVLKAIQSYCK